MCEHDIRSVAERHGKLRVRADPGRIRSWFAESHLNQRYSTVNSFAPDGLGPCGDPPLNTFDAVYRRMVGFVRRVVQRQPIPPADRDDAVQDVFMVAYRRWSQLDSAQSLPAWLHGIAVRTCWNYQRAHRRWSLRFATPQDGVDDRADPEGHVLDHELAREEDLRWLGQAVERLDDKRRQALIFNRIECKSAAEVSRVTGLSPNTVASRVRAALRELRADLTRRDHPPCGFARLAERKP
ncbi:MAG TPA: sigma-70 family RNA polymerase sigma factor [Kofleriaceae bacterium]|nr:sigma-70 family RNA polymerase sigma factor [Kofleriaceae bacterium]